MIPNWIPNKAYPVAPGERLIHPPAPPSLAEAAAAVRDGSSLLGQIEDILTGRRDLPADEVIAMCHRIAWKVAQRKAGRV